MATTRTRKKNALLSAALEYAAKEIAVFPLAAGAKVPAISKDNGGNGCYDATTDSAIIETWWKKYPRANVAMATGEVNNNVVLDADNHTEGVNGEETIRALEKVLGPLPDTKMQLTPNDGTHRVFRYPTGYNIGNYKSDAAKPDKYKGVEISGLDVRGNGGYIVVAPSALRGITKRYEWEVTSYDTEIAELPQPWVEFLNSLCNPKVPKGNRNDTVFRYACQLRAQSIPEDRLRAMVHSFNTNDCVPPLPEREVNTTIASALRYPAGTRLSDMAEFAGERRKGKERFTPEKLDEELQARGYSVRLNLISRQYEVTGRTASGRIMGLDDLTTVLHGALADAYKGVSFVTLEAYITLLGREHQYNPVLDVLSAAKWDGLDRLPQLYHLIGIDDDSLSKALVKKWLLQAVALLFNNESDPFGADGVLVFNGEQGAGKTSLFRHLALKDAWFGEGEAINDRDKDTTRRAITVWISELGEVETTLKSDINSLKNFVTRGMDEYRLPYGRSDVVAPRRTSLCATCNSERYLIDPTGNRRWWSVPFSRTIPREELLALDPLQLWAQVFANVAPLPYEQKKSCFRLTEAEKTALAHRNGDYEKPQKAQPEVEDILAQADAEGLQFQTLTVTQWKAYWPALRPYDSRQIGAALKKCGIETKEYKYDGKKGRWADLPVPDGTH